MNPMDERSLEDIATLLNKIVEVRYRANDVISFDSFFCF